MTASAVNPSLQADIDTAMRRASIGLAGLGRRLAAIAGEAQLFEMAFQHDGSKVEVVLVEPMRPELYEPLAREIKGPLLIQAFLDQLPPESLDPAFPLAEEYPTGTALLQFICAHAIAQTSFELLALATPAAPVTGTLRFAMNDRQGLVVLQVHNPASQDDQDGEIDAGDRPTFH